MAFKSQCKILDSEDQKISQPAGFEPARGDPNRFRVYRLNRSAMVAAGLTELTMAPITLSGEHQTQSVSKSQMR
jgi:hypothetical protein